ncbi:MAG: DUF86 domain-containing protein [Clostridia bacterium]|nr:DUF86 domain-containing protein [Clostridia bacterium]
MDNVKNDKYYIGRIFEDLSYIIRHMQETSAEDFSNNELLQDSMMFRLIQISENARKLSDQYREEHSIIPWTAIFGLRNRIVHDYGNVALDIVYDTLKKDIPDLLNTMKENLDE